MHRSRGIVVELKNGLKFGGRKVVHARLIPLLASRRAIDRPLKAQQHELKTKVARCSKDQVRSAPEGITMGFQRASAETFRLLNHLGSVGRIH